MKLIFTFLLLTFSTYLFPQSEISKVEPFLESVISQFPNVRDIAISNNQSEVVFSAQSYMGDLSALISIKKTNNTWSTPEIVSFSGQFFDLEPYFSSDGLTLYFVSNRPLDSSLSTIKDFDIWYVKRDNLNSKWSSPINMGSPINTVMDEFYPVITDSGNLYFTLDNQALKQKDNIYVSEFINGKYTEPKQLSSSINSDGYEFNAFVARDESYIIYTCYNREGGFGSGDLYISYKSDNGDWTPSENMGDKINSDKMDYCPFVDETSNTLYFTSKRNSVLTTSEKQLTFVDLLAKFNTYENGLSRLYKVLLND